MITEALTFDNPYWPFVFVGAALAVIGLVCAVLVRMERRREKSERAQVTHPMCMENPRYIAPADRQSQNAPPARFRQSSHRREDSSDDGGASGVMYGAMMGSMDSGGSCGSDGGGCDGGGGGCD